MSFRPNVKVFVSVCVAIVMWTGNATGALLSVDFGAAPFSPAQSGFSEMHGLSNAATASQVFGPYTVGLQAIAPGGGIGTGGFFNTSANGSAANINQIATNVRDFFRDYYFTNNNNVGAGINLSVAGLTPNTPYNLTLWTYDADRPVANATTNTWTPINDTTGAGGTVVNQQSPYPSSLATNSTTFSVMTTSGTIDVFGTKAAGQPVAANGGTRLNGFKIDDGAVDLLAVDFGQELTASPVQSGFVGVRGVNLHPEFSQTVGAFTVKLAANSASVSNRTGFFNAAEASVTAIDAGVRDFYRDYYFNNSNTDGEGITLMIEGVTPNTAYDLTLWSYDPDRTSPTNLPAPINWAPSGPDTTGASGVATNHRDPLPTQLADPTHSVTLRVQSTTNTLTVFGARASGSTGGTRLNGFELTEVPEPSTVAIAGMTLAFIVGLGRSRRRSCVNYLPWNKHLRPEITTVKYRT